MAGNGSMFQYTRIREGDGVPVVYGHETTLNDIMPRLTTRARHEAAFAMLGVIMSERNADRAEWTDGIVRITVEREGRLHAYNSEPTAWDNVAALIEESLKSDTLTPYVESRLKAAFDILRPEAGS